MRTGQDPVDIAYEAAKARWPAIRCAPAQFRDWIGRKGIAPDRLEAHGPGLYLACACALQDPSAIATFDRTYLMRITPMSGVVELTGDELAELRQQMRIKLLVGVDAKIGLYRGQGALGAWVRACATRTALNLKRGSRRGATEGTAAVERLVSQEPNAEMVMASVENRNALNAALRGCLVSLPCKEKTLLRLFFVDGMNIDQIGMIFGVHRATIARWLAVVRSEILAGVCRIMAANLRASRSEVRSLMGLSPSDIDLNIGTIFAPTRVRHRLNQTNAAA